MCHGTFEIVPQEVLWSIWGSHQTLWSLPLPNVTWHCGILSYTMTPSIDQTLYQFANLLPKWTLIPIFTLLPNLGGFHRTLQWVRLVTRGRLLLRTPGPVPFGTYIKKNLFWWWDHSFLNLSYLRTFLVSNIPRYFYLASAWIKAFGQRNHLELTGISSYPISSYPK